MARVTGLEPATSGVTGRRSNQLSYTRKAAVGDRRRRGGVIGRSPAHVNRPGAIARVDNGVDWPT